MGDILCFWNTPQSVRHKEDHLFFLRALEATSLPQGVHLGVRFTNIYFGT